MNLELSMTKAFKSDGEKQPLTFIWSNWITSGYEWAPRTGLEVTYMSMYHCDPNFLFAC